MTIRGGGRPRDDRTGAHPIDDGTYDVAPWPDRDPRRYSNGTSRRANRRGGGGGGGGLLRFLVFAFVLAAVVLTAMLTVLRPLVAGAVLDWAYDNPGALRIPFVADVVRDRLGDSLTAPASSDPSPVEFAVQRGDTPKTLAPRLADAGLVRDERAFIFQATLRDLAAKLQEGNFRLAKNMTPDQLVSGLIENRIVITSVPVNFREGLRLEQITAKLQTLGPPLTIDPQAFYDIVKHPPADVLDDYPWIAASGVAEGASLEGFLGPATYSLKAETTAEDLVRMMLTTFEKQVGPDRMNVPASRELTFYEVLTLASVVEKETVVPEERPLVAGVYQYRLNGGIRTRLLEADPTVFYALDTVKLGAMPFTEWKNFTFFLPPGVPLNTVDLPEALAGYNTYRARGLPPGPIVTPSVASIDAALAPDLKDKYLFFLAIPDGNGAHDFSKTLAEHQEKQRKYGYT